MNKAIKLLTILLLAIITFIGCTSKEINSEQVAKEFGIILYTVDKEQVTEYKNMIEEGKLIEFSINKNIQPLMTEKGYERILSNRHSILNIQVCAKGNYTLEVTDFILNENLYGEKEDKATYYYEAKLRFVSNDGKYEQTVTAKGYIGLLKENGQWKVNAYSLETKPKFYKEILNEL